MKVKTSVSLSKETLKALDRLGRERSRSRSSVIEWAVHDLLEREARRLRDARDLQRINENAEALNRKALDSLADQIDLFEERP